MRENLVRRLRERRLPPIGLILWGLAAWGVLALIAQIGFRLIG
ncbi:hypothetical protein [Caulobacter soli]|nr:hypothetical protein [Caulobacter soli]